MTAVNEVAHSRQASGTRALVLTVALSTAGSATALISATGITTATGGLSRGALFSGLFLAASMAAGAIALPFAPRAAHRFGTRQAVLGMWSIVAAAWIASGALIIAGAPPMWVVMIAAPVVGAGSAIAGVLSNIVYRAYLESADFSAVVARMTVWRGIGWGLGALVGGFFLNTGSEGIGLVAAGLVKIPLLIVLARHAPAHALATPERPKAPWHEIRGAFAESPTLRRTAVMGVSMALFAAPVMTLVVPIAQSLRHAPLYQGAGFLMVGFAIGELLSPQVVSKLPHGGRPLINAARTGAIAGGFLIALGLVSGFFSFRTELGLWAVVAIGIGAFRFASRAYSQGSAAASRGLENAASSLTAAAFIAGIAGPIGVLGWSLALGSLGAEVTAALAGVALAIVSTGVFLRTRGEDVRA